MKATRRTRRGWRTRMPIPTADPEPPPPPFALHLLAAIAVLDGDEQRACLRELGQLDELDGADRHAALARLGERLGVGPPPDHFWV
jgi:hypothetical protein